VNRSADEEKLEALLGPADIETPSHQEGAAPSINIKNESQDLIKITKSAGQNDDSSTLSTSAQTVTEARNAAVVEYQCEEMSPEQQKINIAKMTVVWSACSFSNYLLNFMNKYLEGSIYTNNYLEGYAGGLSIIMGGFLYAKAGMKNSLVISFGMALLTGILVCVLEGKVVDLPHSYLH
jgi:hypothetical protein